MSPKTPDLFADVNKAADCSHMTDLEKKHTPVICAPDTVKPEECFEVVVEVGKLMAHPNEKDHFIEFIDLYAGNVYLAKLDLTAETTCPALKVGVALPKDLGPIRAFARCNMHGVWEGVKPVCVR